MVAWTRDRSRAGAGGGSGAVAGAESETGGLSNEVTAGDASPFRAIAGITNGVGAALLMGLLSRFRAVSHAYVSKR